jgi:threonine/homoserine/homoserine lactone efflux protein
MFVKGLAVGFAIAAPVGPIGVLCIRRSIGDGPLMGFAAGLGAATADAAYGCIAGFGLTAVSGFLQAQQLWLALLGGAFLCYLGVRAYVSPPAQAATPTGTGYIATYGSTFFLTITNPATILSFVAAFSVLGLAAATDYFAATSLVLGVFVGSAVWWAFLSTSVGFFRSRITPAWTRAVNIASGVILVGFGLYAISRVFAR